ncbi:hypothetical protein [Chthonobacter albigriseus]|uniref:hypothetical protein n=1 Tax=Chthonobacter albigriseus TaxID=1683161 RepID=UPI0015EF0A5F|nr:hypothetical protein [Chthonobacter albigriseus]
MSNGTEALSMSTFDTPLGPVGFTAPRTRHLSARTARERARAVLDVVLIVAVFGFIAATTIAGSGAFHTPVSVATSTSQP